jgi:hypothetical protein
MHKLSSSEAVGCYTEIGFLNPQNYETRDFELGKSTLSLCPSKYQSLAEDIIKLED